MIICAGEILADMIDEKDGRYRFFAGGAPFNAACCLKTLGAKCGFCGSVGGDIIGELLISAAQKMGFEYLNVRRDQRRNTTLAFVTNGQNGERSFGFLRKNTADSFLPAGAADEIVQKADIIHIGSLPLSQKAGRDFADSLIAKAREKGKKISFDVNYREDLFGGEKAKILIKYARLADYVKFSADELFLTGESDLNKALKKFAQSGRTVFVSLGEKGSVCCCGDQIFAADSFSVKAVDTTGAGDAFFAGVLSAIDGGETDFVKILTVANACGALTVSQKGAFPQWNKSQIQDLYNKRYGE